MERDIAIDGAVIRGNTMEYRMRLTDVAVGAQMFAKIEGDRFRIHELLNRHTGEHYMVGPEDGMPRAYRVEEGIEEYMPSLPAGITLPATAMSVRRALGVIRGFGNIIDPYWLDPRFHASIRAIDDILASRLLEMQRSEFSQNIFTPNSVVVQLTAEDMGSGISDFLTGDNWRRARVEEKGFRKGQEKAIYEWGHVLLHNALTASNSVTTSVINARINEIAHPLGLSAPKINISITSHLNGLYCALQIG